MSREGSREACRSTKPSLARLVQRCKACEPSKETYRRPRRRAEKGSSKHLCASCVIANCLFVALLGEQRWASLGLFTESKANHHAVIAQSSAGYFSIIGGFLLKPAPYMVLAAHESAEGSNSVLTCSVCFGRLQSRRNMVDGLLRQ